MDWIVLDWIQEHLSSAFLDAVFVFVTHLGDHAVIWILLAIVLLMNGKTRRAGIRILAGLLLGFLVGNLAIKNIVRRPRPFEVRGIEPIISPPKDHSFPSGHTTSSFVSAWTLFREDKKKGIPALLLAGCIAFSRLYLFVHFPSDILGGILLGYGIARITEFLEKILLEKPNTKTAR
ncbi:MAG: phosphatase PAP2 family protein [Oscillospiraceae bacterium]|nr:phosphatase PAP2 family protein [Oscillospiraceae bacterium]